MPRILCVLPYVPWPARSGGHLRTLRLVEALASRHDVTIVAAATPGAEPEELQRRTAGTVHVVSRRSGDRVRDLLGVAAGRPLRYGRYGGSAMHATLARLLARRRFDAVHFDHLHTAPLARVVRERLAGAPVLLDQHNVESVLVSRLAAQERGPHGGLLALQARAIARLEEEAVRRMDVVLCCSEVDAAILRRMGARFVQVVPNGADFARHPPERAGPLLDLVFVGALDWRPNVLAALELAREIWPLVARRLPGARLVLAGRAPPAEVRRVASATILVTGSVPSVQPYLRGAFASALPLRAGSGTRLKVLEAAAARVPVVATALAVEGLPFAHGREVLLAEAPAEFADAIIRLFHDAALRERLATGAAEQARLFSWERITADLLRFYDTLLALAPSAPRGGAFTSRPGGASGVTRCGPPSSRLVDRARSP